MYDFLSSFHEISVAIKVCIDVITILQKGDFRLTKFISNNCTILQALPTNNVSPKLAEINFPLNNFPIERALGYYGTQKRIISYKIHAQISLN